MAGPNLEPGPMLDDDDDDCNCECRTCEVNPAITDAVTYLNSGSLGPRLHAVNAAGHAAVERMATPWNIRSTDWFADAPVIDHSPGNSAGARWQSLVRAARADTEGISAGG